MQAMLHARSTLFCFVFFSLVATAETHGQKLGFNRDVLPILSAKCFQCHGADVAARQADLRLDQVASATEKRDDRIPIVPGRPDQSELIHRIQSDDANEMMPPAELNNPLTDEEKQILEQWIAEGAEYEQHWAFVPPRKPPIPAGEWGETEVDRFVLRRLRQVGLVPQSKATREQLIRRASFDLTGLPPTPAQLEAYREDTAPLAYERLVDRLLASPRFGERMAVWWLDGAHYGDSHGYDNDLENSQWPWRTWVIDAFNRSQPFDQFTVEQLAGDLIPNPTDDQVLATAFNRNHRIQTEDGAIDEEWRTEYVVDRVETMGAMWMGLTLGCCRCHDHKYDPISQREFYQLFSLFNNLDEKGFINNLRGSAEPRVRYRPQQFAKEEARINNSQIDSKAKQQALKSLESEYPWVMIMREMPSRRDAYILARGQYDARGEKVEPGLPAAFLPASDAGEVTRLTLAKWLVDGRHPLTARVIVNRIWEELFGIGLVESSENFGVQAEWPSHPELLDWLAVDFVESGWDMKTLVRKIVLSASYQQSDHVDALRLERDPQNRLLSRGPRQRLSAEMIRDQALLVSGMLHGEIGGPSVRPYQPPGLWEEVEKRGTFQQDHGQNLYRRSLYTAIRKTVPPPGMVLFDLPSREVCAIRRVRTNTPLQALALMNEITYVEAAKMLAARMLVQGTDPSERIAWGFQVVTQRLPQQEELEVLRRGYERRLAKYRQQPDAAKALISQGEMPAPEGLSIGELAAMTTVANVILNLDEAINR